MMEAIILGISFGMSFCSIFLTLRMYRMIQEWIDRVIPVVVEYEIREQRRNKKNEDITPNPRKEN